jgi:nicotinamide riboside kinase
MRIAIVGAQGTGKTTLLNKIKESGILDDSYVFMDEIVRSLVRKKNIKINEEGDYESQLLILQTHQANALNHSHMVTDRSCVDAEAYALYNHSKGYFTEEEMNEFEEIFLSTLVLYDKVFFLPVEFDIVSDNFRSTDKSFQKNISDIMEGLLEACSIDFIKLKGGVDGRFEEFKRNVPTRKLAQPKPNKDSLKILWVNPKDLVQSKENNKDHRDNLDAIVESLQLFGWQSPLLISEDMKIISGHGRTQAAIKLGMKEVPVIISTMNKEMSDEFRIVDNVTQAAGKIDMVKVTSILKGMNPQSKHLRHIKSIVSDITQIRHWMEDYLDPSNPNKNKAVEDAFKRAREYQDATGFMYEPLNKGCVGLKVTGNLPQFSRDYSKDPSKSILNQ